MEQLAIQQVKAWLQEIVIGLNFCPFAQQPFETERIKYLVYTATNTQNIGKVVQDECKWLQQHPEIDTTLIIFPELLQSFAVFLQQVKNVNTVLERKKLIQAFQLAHFHPHYVFEGNSPQDAANYTNRSPYPILHIIRQEQLTKILKNIKNPHLIPQNNIRLATVKGAVYFEEILKQIHKSTH